MATLKIEHPNGDTLKVIEFPEGTRISVDGVWKEGMPVIDRLEVLVPHDFALMAHVDQIDADRR